MQKKDSKVATDSIIYSTLVGGYKSDNAKDLVIDNLGNAYIAGITYSTDFSVSGSPLQANNKGGSDCFIAKINQTENSLLYSTYIGGSGNDGATAIKIDSQGNIIICGETISLDFPTTEKSFQAKRKGLTDAFITKINPEGSLLIYSTYLGGSLNDCATNVALDNTGNAYVCGRTDSQDFPTTQGTIQNTLNQTNDSDVFISKMNETGSMLLYSTYLGGSDWEDPGDIVVDTENNAYICGKTSSSDFPTTKESFNTLYHKKSDIFISKVNKTGSSLIYSTYIGGSLNDYASSIALDSSGNAYITGTTESPDYPITLDAYQMKRKDLWDVYVTKLDSTGKFLQYSTFLGGSSLNGGTGIAVDIFGNAFICGYIDSSGFPTTQLSFQDFYRGNIDAFISEIDPLGKKLKYSTYLGGDDIEDVRSIAVDSSGFVYIAGSTESYDFPVTDGSYLTKHKKNWDSFIVKINLHSVIIELWIGKLTVTINGKETRTDVPPLIKSGRSFIPIRFIAETFGAVTSFNPKTQEIIISNDKINISLFIGKTEAILEINENKKKETRLIKLDAPPFLEKGRTFTPLRFIAETFGAKLDWKSSEQKITIYLKK